MRKTRATAGKKKAWRKKDKYELGRRQPARIKTVRVRSDNVKWWSFRLDTRRFVGGSKPLEVGHEIGTIGNDADKMFDNSPEKDLKTSRSSVFESKMFEFAQSLKRVEDMLQQMVSSAKKHDNQDEDLKLEIEGENDVALEKEKNLEIDAVQVFVKISEKEETEVSNKVRVFDEIPEMDETEQSNNDEIEGEVQHDNVGNNSLKINHNTWFEVETERTTLPTVDADRSDANDENVAMKTEGADDIAKTFDKILQRSDRDIEKSAFNDILSKGWENRFNAKLLGEMPIRNVASCVCGISILLKFSDQQDGIRFWIHNSNLRELFEELRKQSIMNNVNTVNWWVECYSGSHIYDVLETVQRRELLFAGQIREDEEQLFLLAQRISQYLRNFKSCCGLSDPLTKPILLVGLLDTGQGTSMRKRLLTCLWEVIQTFPSLPQFASAGAPEIAFCIHPIGKAFLEVFQFIKLFCPFDTSIHAKELHAEIMKFHVYWLDNLFMCLKNERMLMEYNGDHFQHCVCSQPKRRQHVGHLPASFHNSLSGSLVCSTLEVLPVTSLDSKFTRSLWNSFVKSLEVHQSAVSQYIRDICSIISLYHILKDLSLERYKLFCLLKSMETGWFGEVENGAENLARHLICDTIFLFTVRFIGPLIFDTMHALALSFLWHPSYQPSIILPSSNLNYIMALSWEQVTNSFQSNNVLSSSMVGFVQMCIFVCMIECLVEDLAASFELRVVQEANQKRVLSWKQAGEPSTSLHVPNDSQNVAGVILKKFAPQELISEIVVEVQAVVGDELGARSKLANVVIEMLETFQYFALAVAACFSALVGLWTNGGAMVAAHGYLVTKLGLEPYPGRTRFTVHMIAEGFGLSTPWCCSNVLSLDSLVIQEMHKVLPVLICNYHVNMIKNLNNQGKVVPKMAGEEADVCGLICSSLQLFIQQFRSILEARNLEDDAFNCSLFFSNLMAKTYGCRNRIYGAPVVVVFSIQFDFVKHEFWKYKLKNFLLSTADHLSFIHF